MNSIRPLLLLSVLLACLVLGGTPYQATAQNISLGRRVPVMRAGGVGMLGVRQIRAIGNNPTNRRGIFGMSRGGSFWSRGMRLSLGRYYPRSRLAGYTAATAKRDARGTRYGAGGGAVLPPGGYTSYDAQPVVISGGTGSARYSFGANASGASGGPGFSEF